ncbi:uncharacterized protein LOC111273683 isoform X3 [Varroa jacobsoni]|uniref:uncharacterized protein LOC111273683 isoform X3 n=1 Tax=Varroa jacobsoni TaxID=62625 RepID=UPI000BF285A8|nr:uncharacterized protein LOC111273683 isoform X3 [Varroa jacobsoni]
MEVNLSTKWDAMDRNNSFLRQRAMSARKFRIISDSEEEDNDIGPQSGHGVAVRSSPQSVLESESDRSYKSNDSGTTGFRGSKKLKKRRARLDSDDDDSESEKAESGVLTTNRNESLDTGASEDETSHLSRENCIFNDEQDHANNNDGDDDFNRQYRCNEPHSQEQRQRGDNDDDHDNSSERMTSEEDGNDGPDENQQDEGNQENNDDGDDRRAVKEASGRMVATKRVVKNPQPKLDVTRLTGERGLGQLRNMHPHIRLKGKGHEKEDLRCILHHLQLWGHRMFPRMQMKDIFERCERLGTKMPVKVYLRKMRTGQIYDFNQPVIEDEDDILGTEGKHAPDDDNHRPADKNGVDNATILEDGRDLFEQLVASETTNPNLENCDPTFSYKISSDNSESTIMVSDDLRAQIAVKRLKALQKREQIRREREQSQQQSLEVEQMMIG